MSEPRTPRRPALLVALASLLYLEGAALGAATVYLLVEVVSQHPDSYASAIALIVLAALATVWLFVLALHTLRGRSWIRGGVVTWQILQGIIGITAIVGGSVLGWALVVVAVLVLVLLFTRPVLATTRRAPRED